MINTNLQNEYSLILNNYHLGRILSFEKLNTSGNIAFMINSDSGKYLLRLCPTEGPRSRSKEEIEAELELIHYLLKHQFPVPTPVAQNNGEEVVSWYGCFGYLRKFDEGEPILDPDLSQVEQFGQVLGRFHKLVHNFKTKYPREHVFDPQTTLTHFLSNKTFIEQSAFKNSREFTQKIAEELVNLQLPTDLPSGTIHEDLGKRHVLWKNGQICGVIDFDRAYYSYLVLDLGQALRGWCVKGTWFNWDNNNLKALLHGYRKERKLSDKEKLSLIDSIKFAVIERGISYCMRYIEFSHHQEDEEYAYKSAFDFLQILEDNRDKINRYLDE